MSKHLCAVFLLVLIMSVALGGEGGFSVDRHGERREVEDGMKSHNTNLTFISRYLWPEKKKKKMRKRGRQHCPGIKNCRMETRRRVDNCPKTCYCYEPPIGTTFCMQDRYWGSEHLYVEPLVESDIMPPTEEVDNDDIMPIEEDVEADSMPTKVEDEGDQMPIEDIVEDDITPIKEVDEDDQMLIEDVVQGDTIPIETMVEGDHLPIERDIIPPE